MDSFEVAPSPKQPRTEQESEATVTEDVAEVVKRRATLTESEKYNFYYNHYTPGADFKFPREKSRSFRHEYLRKYKWLVYSPKQNGGYCLPCVLFASTSDTRKGKGAFVETAFVNFKKAYEMCKTHAERKYHIDAVVNCEAFIEIMSGRQESVAVQLERGLRDKVKSNRKKLHSIIETIVFCGRQNIALRGHRDSGTDSEGVQSEGKNHGNFRALLDFRVSAGDTVLASTGDKNATYISPDIQNQIIMILGYLVRETILKKVRLSVGYTLIADEVTDCSNKEQLCIVLRYVEPVSSKIKEDLVTILECDSGITGEALTSMMLGFVTENLNPSKLRGQAYDGAGNMAGKKNGVAARIANLYPLALYTHCASHCLNLAVVASFDETNVRNMMGVANRLFVFFSSHPRR